VANTHTCIFSPSDSNPSCIAPGTRESQDYSPKTPQGSVATKHAHATAPFIATWAHQGISFSWGSTLEILVPGGCRLLQPPNLWWKTMASYTREK